MKAKIKLIGCDDTTELETIITKEQYEFLLDLAIQINKQSIYNCQPKISIFVFDPIKEEIIKEETGD